MQLSTHPDTEQPIGEGQRILSAIGGSLLVYYVTKKHKGDSLLLLGGAYLLYRALSGHCPITKAWKASSHHRHTASGINVRTHLVVNKPQEEVYAFWRSLENWPLFMRHIGNVDELNSTTSAWTMKTPGGEDLRWEARIVKEEKNAELSLTSVPGAPIMTTARINFAATPGNATRIDVLLSYRAPLGPIGEKLSRLLTPAFREKVEADIHNVKHYMEDAGKTGG